jgi:signal transduction histidine kinase
VPSIEIHDRHVSWRRLLAGGIILTALAGIGGVALEWWWFGASDEIAARRVAEHLHRQFDGMVRAVSGVSARIATHPTTAKSLSSAPDGARPLFELADETRRTSASPDAIAVTIYGPNNVARAWAGSPSDILAERIAGPDTLFVTASPLGLRLVHVRPVLANDTRWIGAVATERILSSAPVATAIAPAEYTLPTPLAPAIVRVGPPLNGPPRGVILRAPTGEALAEAWVDPASLRQARAAWRRRVFAAMLAFLGLTVLLLVGPLLDRRVAGPAIDRPPSAGAAASARNGMPSSEQNSHYLRTTAASLALTSAGGLLLWCAFAAQAGRVPSVPAGILVLGGTAAALVSLLAGPTSRLRIAARRTRPPGGTALLAMAQFLAGGAVGALMVGLLRLLEFAANAVAIDLRHFSLYPVDRGRLMLLTGFVGLQLAVVWAGTLALVAASVPWRVAALALAQRLTILGLWIAPSVVAAAMASARGWPVPPLALVLSTLACGLAAFVGPRVTNWYRRATVAARIFALFVAFLIPTLLLHPAMDFFTERATRELIVTRYAAQAQNHVQALRDRMDLARREVDRIAELSTLVQGGTAGSSTAACDAAFLVWKHTVLARERLTSNVELYGASGNLVSRFALNVPEYSAAAPQKASGCAWDWWAEVAPFGAEERRMLHAERGICVPDAEGGFVQHGTVILHAVFEYETLPFITSQNPYFEVFRSAETQSEEAVAGNVEVAIYGWGLRPLYTSGRSAWPLTDEIFQRVYRSREPFWAEASTEGVSHRVYFSNDRDRIFAIGYPKLTIFDHFVHLAEYATFGAAVFALVLLGTAMFTRTARQRPRVGRALLREIRASFYRKLLLAFVLAAIIPVLTLALVIRAYFANLLQADIRAEAARTAAVGQRVIEEFDTTLRGTAQAQGTPTDDVMVWIEQVIDQDVNVFTGARLVATSERDLFCSGVLPTRTPDDVFRAIVLQRLPSFVREDSIGGFSYMLAAAPVRGAGEEALLTVPLALRQREVEREIDELDRGVHLAALFFVLLGAAIGLSMAERIADPVRRLTRATGRIARGDFDARIAVKSADELRRLVDAFNSMAEELKAQRVQLERTHRLEAWAEMARQVAHEIKNPLTPIQLSAEHLHRVHADRGEPLGPVLDNCVATILGQVRLLRQISSEFSSFASSPTARPANVDLPELVAEVVNPYRTGLPGRIEIVNHVPAHLPPVYVDRTLVARALANIVENALHAMPGAATITLAAAVEPEAVRLYVTDTGVGMDEEALSRVFEPYFSTKTTGTGLGLPIARRNIELNGGSVTVSSRKGVGTTVVVRLPRAVARAASG